MADFEAKIIDHKKILIAFKDLPKDMLEALNDELYSGANDIRNNIILGMKNTKKAPWFYWKGKKPGRKKHYPSAPGEYPSIDSGELISRIVSDQRKNEVEVGVEAGAPYAGILEGGAFYAGGAESMAPRPFLQPATDEEAPKIERNILKAIEKAAEDAFK